MFANSLTIAICII